MAPYYHMSNVKIYLKPEDEVNTSFTPTVDKKNDLSLKYKFLPVVRPTNFQKIHVCTYTTMHFKSTFPVQNSEFLKNTSSCGEQQANHNRRLI